MLIDGRQGPLLERLTRERSIAKKEVLEQLADTNYSYELLRLWKRQLLVREDARTVVLCHPDAVNRVLNILDEYDRTLADGLQREADERRRRRQSVVPDSRGFLEEHRFATFMTPRAFGEATRGSGFTPSAEWVSRIDGSRPDYEMQYSAARYDYGSNRLRINADWRGYLKLRSRVVADVDDASPVTDEEAWKVAHDVWGRTLARVVFSRRLDALEDDLADRLDVYLSEDALTTAMANLWPMLTECRDDIRRLAWKRRRSVQLADVDESASE